VYKFSEDGLIFNAQVEGIVVRWPKNSEYQGDTVSESSNTEWESLSLNGSLKSVG
jgi:hypothetical protein